MISCKHAAYLGSKSTFGALTMVERMKLRFHLKMCTCPTCHDFAKDNTLIDDAVDKVMQERSKQKVALSEEQRKKILDALK